MTEPAAVTPGAIKSGRVKKNTEVARALLKVVEESIAEAFAGREIVTRTEVDRAFAKLADCWPHIQSLFEYTCADCLQTRAFVPDERRQDHLTRLIFAKVVMEIEAQPVGQGLSFPRLAIGGLQRFIARVLSKNEWRILNDQAGYIFEYIGSDADDVIAHELSRNRVVHILCERVFIALLRRFRSFNQRKADLFSAVNESITESLYRLDNQHFCLLFEAMFRDLHDRLEGDETRLRMVLAHGEETIDKLRGVFDAYFRFKESVNRRVLPGGGRIKAAVLSGSRRE